MKRLICTFFAALTATALSAQNYGEALALPLWDNETAPHSNELVGTETIEKPGRVALTTSAVLYIFPADASKATGQGVVICPGGGYHRLSMDNEGALMAEWFAANGITAAVLKYRMPNGHPEVPLEDAVTAIRILKGDIKGLKIAGVDEVVKRGYTAKQVGIVGSSAGGHLAAMTSTMGTTRPDFSILFYPVITGEVGWYHGGSFDNLLGKVRTAKLTASFSLDHRVDGQTPPAIILHCDDDKTVPSVNATRYYEALKQNGIEASLHIYPTGGHGWGMRESYFRDAWQAAVLEWLRRRQ